MQRVVAFVLTSVVAASSLHAQTGHPVYGRWGFDTTGIDRSVKPGDDFFSFVNGTWVKNTVIPVDKSVYSPRAAMSDNTEARLRTIMEKAQARAGHAPTTDAGKVGAFYASFMDSARIERLGAKPLAPVLRDIRAATTQRALTALMGKSATGFYGSAFGFGIDADLKHPDRYVVYLNQGGLTLPDRDYYLEPDMSKERAGFEAYVATMLTRLDWPDAAQRAKDVVALETRFAEVSWDRTQQRDYTATYNPMTVQALSTMAPAFDWPGFLANAGLRGESSVIVGEKSAFPKIAAVLAQTPVNVLQAWMAFGATDLAAPYLSSPFVNASFVFRGTVLSGQQAQSERWKRGVHAVSGGDYGAGGHFDRFGNIGWAVGTLYAAQYFPPAAKAKIVALVNDLKAAYRVRIAALDWMSAATRTEALKKLDTYVIKVGYPDTPRDYSRVVIRDDDLVGNVERAAAADWAFYANRRHGPVDRSDWAMTPQTNDAYNGSLRDIVFPAGILPALAAPRLRPSDEHAL
ncbi:MAG: peptidase M13, partial [bacterium]